MAQYRRRLNKAQQRLLHNEYNNHRDADGGIFTADKRRKLLGLKAKTRNQFKEETPDFWYDVRTFAKNGVTDLKLLSEVAHPEQLKEIFKYKNTESFPKWEKRYARDDLVGFFTHLFWETTDQDFTEKEKWKYELARDVAAQCLYYLRQNPQFKTKLHNRLFEDVLDTIYPNRDSSKSGFE